MGIDTCIYVKTRDGQAPCLYDGLLDGAKVVSPSGFYPDGATHEISQLWRYYGVGYERGPWPVIAATLLTLHACHNVETVWYFGDCSEGDEPFTPERIHELNTHYMHVGTRPYYKTPADSSTD